MPIPTLNLPEIVQQLRTSWGGSLEGTTESWTGSGNVGYFIGGAPFANGSNEVAHATAMSSLMASRAALAFKLWDDVIARDLDPASTAAASQIQFEYTSQTTSNVTAYTFAFTSPNGTGPYGTADNAINRTEVWLNSTAPTHNADDDMFFGGYGFEEYLHEIGHSLGLSHPGAYNSLSGGTITYANNAEYTLDNRQYTVMSYFGAYAPGLGWQQDGTFSNWLYSSTPMVDDVAAIQAIYGADTTTRTGATTYGFNNTSGRDVFDFTVNTAPIVTIWDAGGTDTIDLSGFSANQRVDLREGDYSDVGGMTNNLAIAYGTVIENVVGGSGVDVVTGNGADNRIAGEGGRDVLTGGGGNDVFVFDSAARSDAVKHVMDTVTDYASGDQIDVSSLVGGAYGAGQTVGALVRVIASGDDANVVIDADGTGSSAGWIEIAHLVGVHAGDSANVVLISGSPSGSTITVSASDLSLTSSMYVLGEFGASASYGGWSTEDQFPRVIGDVNGDGIADIIGFGNAGASVSLGTGGGHFATAIAGIYEFGAATFGGGWTTENQFPRMTADVNGDGMADIVGFGNAGASVSLATGGGHFASAVAGIYEFGAAGFGGGWSTQDQFPRVLGDVNGDGMADIVGFGNAGVTVALATGGGHFAPGALVLSEFGAAGFGGGWTTQDQHPRAVADVNGDGMADIIGFGGGGVTVALATGGGHFAASAFKLGDFGSSEGWMTQDQFPRFVSDVNGDGMADVVGFGPSGVSVALATGGGSFAAAHLEVDEFGSSGGAGGWTSENTFPRMLGDVNGDGTADVIGFGNAGVTVSQLHGFLL